MMRQLIDALCFRLIHGPTVKGQVEQLDIGPGDRLLIKVPGTLSPVDLIRLNQQVGEYLPAGARALVLDGKSEVKVIRFNDGTIIRNAA